ncbi:MAG: AAA family ATPase [Candidatus Coprovivens sp.]
MEKALTEIGIKYKVIKISDTMYILTPIGVVEGYSVGENFFNEIVHKTVFNVESLQNPELVDSMMSIDSLKELYEYDDIEFIKEFYLEEEKDYLLTIEIKDGKIIKRKVNYKEFIRVDERETYERQKDIPAVTLNCDALDSLMNSSSIQEIREKLIRYRKLIKQYRDKEKKESITNVTVANGHITEVGINKKVGSPEIMKKAEQPAGEAPIDKNSFSVRGLYEYLKERVIGHDEELKSIATTMIMNYRAKPEYGTESILIVGPTGTGKTETIQNAANYLNIPYTSFNTANIVPQGIKGTSLEDLLYILLIKSGYDMEKAQRGIIFLDEFDKLGKSSLDIKESVKDILLTYIAGGTFNIDKPSGDYEFDTRMLNKVFAGAFGELFEEKKSPMGFGTTKDERNQIFKPELITKADYYGKELVTRIPHIYSYKTLTREQQRRVLLESKLSQLLLKKHRYEDEFGITTIIDDSYIEAILDQLSQKDKSMRDLNNLILSTLGIVEYELMENEGKVKQLILTSETVTDPTKFSLH